MVLEEVSSSPQMGEETSEKFENAARFRQGSPLSMLLFNIVLEKKESTQ